MFQSTHPRRVWHNEQCSMLFPFKFQSTHPRRVWPLTDIHSSMAVSFNPHTHAGCDQQFFYCPYCHSVSIHTPTQGVTGGGLAGYACRRFQSTHPRRVWLIGFIKPHEIQRFQSTHPRRVWLWWCVMAHHVFEFQSTHPRRVWQPVESLRQEASGFNPHTHAGCDIYPVQPVHDNQVSIHTPTQGVTSHPWTRRWTIWFQSTHPRRVWHMASLGCFLYEEFQSTHPRRVWLKSKIPWFGNRLFQSTHPRRVWLWVGESTQPDYGFQSTHPRRVWPGQNDGKISGYSVSIHTPTQGVTIVLPTKRKLGLFQSTHPRRVWLYI